MPHNPFTMRNSMPTKEPCPLSSFHGKEGASLPLLSPKRKEKRRGHPRVGCPISHASHLSSSSLFFKRFLKYFIASFWVSKRGFFSDFTVENWRRKVLPNERKRRKKKGSSFLCAALKKKEFFF